MRLHNLLEQPGGISEEGRPVQFRLRYSGKDGSPQVRDVCAVMLPVSEAEWAQAKAEAEKVEGRTLPEGLEFIVRLLQASLRDPGDLSKRLIEDPRDLQLLRAGLVEPQYALLLEEYRQLLRTEYPLVPSKEQVAELERHSADFSSGAQPRPG